MKATLPLSALALAALVAVGSATARQDDEGAKPARRFFELPAEEQMAAQMKMMELAGPGPEHARLAKYTGTFETEHKLWMMPGADPVTFKGTQEQEMVLGGRFLQIKGKGEFPMMGDVETLTFYGYDRRSQKFTTIGMDTMGTYWVTAAGKDRGDGTVVLSGVDHDESLGIDQVYDFELEFVDDDTLKTTLIFHDLFEEGPYKLMEMVARRVKPEGGEGR